MSPSPPAQRPNKPNATLELAGYFRNKSRTSAPPSKNTHRLFLYVVHLALDERPSTEVADAAIGQGQVGEAEGIGGQGHGVVVGGVLLAAVDGLDVGVEDGPREERPDGLVGLERAREVRVGRVVGRRLGHPLLADGEHLLGPRHVRVRDRQAPRVQQPQLVVDLQLVDDVVRPLRPQQVRRPRPQRDLYYRPVLRVLEAVAERTREEPLDRLRMCGLVISNCVYMYV